MSVDAIREAIRDVIDFPKPGIVFKDITPVLADVDIFRSFIDLLEERHKDSGITCIAAVDARGFLFAGALAMRLNVGIVPIRKSGKLPYETFSESYELEYGEAVLEIHSDAFKPEERVLIVDDLLATGGTALASAKLVEKAGGKVVAIDFLIELDFLQGREKLKGYDVYAPVVY